MGGKDEMNGFRSQNSEILKDCIQSSVGRKLTAMAKGAGNMH